MKPNLPRMSRTPHGNSTDCSENAHEIRRRLIRKRERSALIVIRAQRGMIVATIPLSIELLSRQGERSVAVRAVSVHSVARQFLKFTPPVSRACPGYRFL